jgi:hypothetical protein
MLQRYEMLAGKNPILAEAVRIIKSMSPEQMEQWFSTYEGAAFGNFPEDANLDEIIEQKARAMQGLEAQINLPDKQKDACMSAIHSVLVEMPEFAAKSRLNDAEILKEEEEENSPETPATDVVPTENDTDEVLNGTVTSNPNPTGQNTIAKTTKFVLTRQAWETIGKQAKWA